MKHQRSKACDIPSKVKQAVYARDGGACVWCAKKGVPNAHFISRAHGGLGIEENILTLCLKCHNLYDQSTLRGRMRNFFRRYLQSKYPEWDEEKLYFKKD